MSFISEALENYCTEHSSPESELLYRLQRETHLKVLRPRMLSGHLQGLLLEMIIAMLKPKYILEIGTYTGYSTLCLADKLEENAVLHSIEINPELEDIITKYVVQHPKNNQIKIHFGDALNIIPNLDMEWDLVFMDAEKSEYSSYYDLVFPKLNKGGFILTDNVLWSGKVIEELKPNDKETKAVLEFNQKIQNDVRVKNLLLPFRDGLMWIEKL